ncbi:MAG: hypothetical protein ACREL7_04480, partial [Longimicrobiales bacterium]
PRPWIMTAARRSQRREHESEHMPEVEWHAERPIHRRRVYLVLAVLVLVTALASVALRNVEWVVTG